MICQYFLIETECGPVVNKILLLTVWVLAEFVEAKLINY